MVCNCRKTGIVVPCYNEGSRLANMDYTHLFEEFSEARFCFVNDGSSDNTLDVLRDFEKGLPNQVAVVNLGANVGKGEAVRAGVSHILTGHSLDFVGYWDADMSTPLSEICRFVQVLKQRAGVQFVCGSRIRRMGAVIERFWCRHYLGRVFATAASLVLGMPIYDTQCGAKLMRVELAKHIFSEAFLSRWLFDVELLARTKKIVGEDEMNEVVFELPLEKWQDMGGSRVTFYHYFIRAPYDLIRIFCRYEC